MTINNQTVIMNERNKIQDLVRTKLSEKGTRLFLAGPLFFCNYLKLYPTSTQKTAAKAKRKQRYTEHSESGKTNREERNNQEQKPKTNTTPMNHNIILPLCHACDAS